MQEFDHCPDSSFTRLEPITIKSKESLGENKYRDEDMARHIYKDWDSVKSKFKWIEEFNYPEICKELNDNYSNMSLNDCPIIKMEL